MILRKFPLFFVAMTCFAQCPPCTNQVDFLTTPLDEGPLPFRITVEQADFSLPVGLHSFAVAVYKNEWLLLSGRTNGLHNVDNTDPDSNSFPVSAQNTNAYVINPNTKAVYSRSLNDISSGLSQQQIDLLSVTNSLSYQTLDKKTLYLVGGYGYDTGLQTMQTMPALTAIKVADFMKWVKASGNKIAAQSLRTVFDRLLQVTGGVMWQTNPHQPYLLAFGQNFTGYYLQGSSGTYSQQIRPFQIIDNGNSLYIHPYSQPTPLPTYRRRDLNVVATVKKVRSTLELGYVALSGVFTPGGDDTPGAWTAPIEIEETGSSQMVDPSDFSQAMNNYSCANLGLFSQKTGSMYTLLFGGISASIMSDGDCDANCQTTIPAPGNVLTTCCNLPFTNDITTVEITKNGSYAQYLMSAKFPTIAVDPPPPECPDGPFPPTSPRVYWFGSNSEFIINEDLPLYPNKVIAFDNLKTERLFLGYIVGGIASTILDTNCPADSSPSPYIFKVYLERN